MDLAWDWKSIGSLLATLIFLRTAYRDFFPQELHRFVGSLFRCLLERLNPETKIIIDEYDGTSVNELYGAAQVYLGHHCVDNAPVVCLSKSRGSSIPVASLPSSHTTRDSFQGIPLRWRSNVERFPHSSSSRSSSQYPYTAGRCSLELSFPWRHRHAVRSLYIPYVFKEADNIRLSVRERRLYTNRSVFGEDHYDMWSLVPFAHPSTFDTLAIDPALRDDILADLSRFVGRQDYYTRVGRAWKRGYLLHGPPGAGKTSLVAAIANLLEFDVYDLELTSVRSNSLLRRLLVSTSPRSIVVVEDVDCSLNLSDRNKKTMGQDDIEAEEGTTVSLSGVLNFVDGLWSSCVGERLMIFTTNHPERLDPALLRPGRMDRQIHLSYCCPAAFRTLARNYLDVGEEHGLMAEVEALLGEVNMTPAEIAEVFMRCDGEGDGADAAMEKVVEEMRRRKETASQGGGSAVGVKKDS